MRRALAVGVAVGLALAGAACTEDPVVLATVPAGDDDDGPHRHHTTRCISSADCSAGEYCDRRSASDSAGFCKLAPAACDAVESLVCGSDGVTYHNDCLRRAHGVSSATPGECDERALGCGGDEGACPGGATCAVLLPPGSGACPAGAHGRCWVLPTTCPTTPDADRWTACADEGAQLIHCLDTCNAIRTGAAHRRATRCD